MNRDQDAELESSLSDLAELVPTKTNQRSESPSILSPKVEKPVVLTQTKIPQAAPSIQENILPTVRVTIPITELLFWAQVFPTKIWKPDYDDTTSQPMITIVHKTFRVFAVTLSKTKSHYPREIHSPDLFSDYLIANSWDNQPPILFVCRNCKNFVHTNHTVSIGQCECAAFNVDTIFQAFNNEYKLAVVKIPQNDQSSWESVFRSDAKVVDGTITQPVVSVYNENYTVYFVAIDPRKTLNLEQFREKRNLVVNRNGEKRMFACYFCKKFVRTDNDGSVCQCDCATYPVDRGYRLITSAGTIRQDSSS